MSTPSSNPFQPPASAVADVEPPPPSLEEAGKGRRFATFLLDYLGVMLVLTVVFVVVVVIFGEGVVEQAEKMPDILFGALGMLGYYTFFEGLWGRTPGKLLLGTRVVDEAGHRPPFGQVVKRTLCRFIPFEAFSFFGERGWHDSLSRTRVVRTR